MEGLLLTQSSAPIVGQISWLLGHLMNGIFNVLSNVFHIENIGLCIIIFTIIIYTLLLPLTYKQQKASRLTSVMSPELQRIQNKYKGKKDQASMMKMQEETKMVYEKYGTSMMGGCSQLLIQLPIIWGLFYVIRNMYPVSKMCTCRLWARFWRRTAARQLWKPSVNQEKS